jgi:hypothetical protein
MPSEEHDSRAPARDSPTSDAYPHLSQITDEHARSFGEDSFYFFLKIHECIFGRVETHPSAAVRELNRLFAERCTDIYRFYRNNQVHLLPKRWVTAFLAYQKDRYAFFSVLPLMALAHILDDLEAVLGRVNVDKEDYDVVLNDIIHCLNIVESPLNTRAGLSGRILGFLQQRLGAPTISAMREIAWKLSRRRKALKPPLPPV